MTANTTSDAVVEEPSAPTESARRLVLNVAWQPQLSDGTIGPDITMSFHPGAYAATFERRGPSVDLYLQLRASSQEASYSDIPSFVVTRLTANTLTRLQRYRWILLAEMSIRSLELEADLTVSEDGCEVSGGRMVVTRDDVHFAGHEDGNPDALVESTRFSLGAIGDFLDGNGDDVVDDDETRPTLRWVGGSVVCAHREKLDEIVASVMTQVPQVGANAHAVLMSAQIAMELGDEPMTPAAGRRSIGV